MQEGKPLKINTFCLMTGLEMPTKKFATELDMKWKPVLRKMMEAPWVQPLPEGFVDDFVQSSYAIATEYFKGNMSYVWLS